MIVDNLTWKTHIELVQNKISKSVGIYFALFYPYINYADIAWSSTKQHLSKKNSRKTKARR